MKLKPRKVHISRAPALVKRGQDVSQLLDVVRWQPPRLALFIEVFESTMFKRLIHGILSFHIYLNFEAILDCLPSLVNCQNLIPCSSSRLFFSLTEPPALLGSRPTKFAGSDCAPPGRRATTASGPGPLARPGLDCPRAIAQHAKYLFAGELGIGWPEIGP